MRNIYIASTIVFSLLFSDCSQSGRRTAAHIDRTTPNTEEPVKSSGRKTVVKMERVNGVYQIPVEVNGVKMFFIFDTGASTISISETEAMFLYKQGKLTDDCIKGKANFSDAEGNISEGTIIVLKAVQIGDRDLTDVEASVVHNLNAPLLFGQSALGKFVKISIDNDKGEITFE